VVREVLAGEVVSEGDVDAILIGLVEIVYFRPNKKVFTAASTRFIAKIEMIIYGETEIQRHGEKLG